MTNVTRILKVCAVRKAYKGFLLFELNKSENFVSKPILVNAKTNHKAWTYSNSNGGKNKVTKPTLGLIWERFPKFVLGFMAASLLFFFCGKC